MKDPRQSPPPVRDYKQKLLDPRWQRKRLEVLQRDEWRCQKCFNGESTLHVHHHYYERGNDPWDYTMEALVTLCADCHEGETKYRPIEEQALLNAMREIGLFHEQIQEFSDGIRFWEELHISDVMVSVISWVMQNEAMMFELADRYFDYLKFFSQNGTLSSLHEQMTLRVGSLRSPVIPKE